MRAALAGHRAFASPSRSSSKDLDDAGRRASPPPRSARSHHPTKEAMADPDRVQHRPSSSAPRWAAGSPDKIGTKTPPDRVRHCLRPVPTFVTTLAWGLQQSSPSGFTGCLPWRAAMPNRSPSRLRSPPRQARPPPPPLMFIGMPVAAHVRPSCRQPAPGLSRRAEADFRARTLAGSLPLVLTPILMWKLPETAAPRPMKRRCQCHRRPFGGGRAPASLLLTPSSRPC